MPVAVLADIHSDARALEAVLADAKADAVWVAGDMFGYGARAAETYRLLQDVDAVCVLGNHDSWVAGLRKPPGGLIGDAALVNRAELAASAENALEWLKCLPLVRTWAEGSQAVRMAHGTPADALDGRYYPDDAQDYRWLPGPGEILILGQTHHPILRGTAAGGMLLNPGSVGQPRDGDPRPSWALLDLDTGTAELRRTGG